jgi:AAA family ATPase
MRRPGRLDVEIELSVPSASDRSEILYDILSSRRVGVAEDAQSVKEHCNCVDKKVVDAVATHAHGMVGADLIRVVKEACVMHIDRMLTAHLLSATSSTTGAGEYGPLVNGHVGIRNFEKMVQSSRSMVQSQDIVLSRADLMAALRVVNPSALREVAVEVPTVRWKDIGGMETVKQSLKEVCHMMSAESIRFNLVLLRPQVVEWPLLYPQLFASVGVSAPRGVLLYGPPGCSKTLMAKALATESAMNFLAVRGPELLSKWLGESEKAVQKLFSRARAAAPSIVFFDEIDALASKR